MEWVLPRRFRGEPLGEDAGASPSLRDGDWSGQVACARLLSLRDPGNGLSGPPWEGSAFDVRSANIGVQSGHIGEQSAYKWPSEANIGEQIAYIGERIANGWLAEGVIRFIRCIVSFVASFHSLHRFIALQGTGGGCVCNGATVQRCNESGSRLDLVASRRGRRPRSAGGAVASFDACRLARGVFFRFVRVCRTVTVREGSRTPTALRIGRLMLESDRRMGRRPRRSTDKGRRRLVGRVTRWI